jgi:hypothetical protein
MTLEAHNARQVYRCKALRDGPGGGGHVRRNAPALDTYVSELIVERMDRPDAFSLVVPKKRAPGIDVNALRAEEKRLRNELEEFAIDKAEGRISRAQMIAGTTRVNAKLHTVEQQLATVTAASPLSPLFAPTDGASADGAVRNRWEAMPLGSKRTVVDALMTVTVLPARHGRGFDRDAVKIEWKVPD